PCRSSAPKRRNTAPRASIKVRSVAIGMYEVCSLVGAELPMSKTDDESMESLKALETEDNSSCALNLIRASASVESPIITNIADTTTNTALSILACLDQLERSGWTPKRRCAANRTTALTAMSIG